MSDSSHQPFSQQMEAFKAAAPPLRKPVLTDKDKVRELFVLIQEKRAAGWSYEDIRQELARTVGFQGSRKTLYRYMWALSQEKPSAEPPVASSLATVSSRQGTAMPSLAETFHPDPNRRHFIKNLRVSSPVESQNASSLDNHRSTISDALVDRLNRPL